MRDRSPRGKAEGSGLKAEMKGPPAPSGRDASEGGTPNGEADWAKAWGQGNGMLEWIAQKSTKQAKAGQAPETLARGRCVADEQGRKMANST